MINAIETTSLTKTYGELTAVNNLNLSVVKGELYALLGVNGAGKTTTIKMLSCLTRPTSGEALMEGHSITTDQLSVKQLTNLSPQQSAVAPNLTVEENIVLMALLYGADRRRASAKCQELMNEFSLAGIARQKAKILSGGWQRRLSIAMALVSDPKILFLDEPTQGLDVIARRELWNEIRRLKGRTTIVLTTHYMEEVEALADRVGVMANGRLKAVGTVGELEQLTATNSLEEAFVALAAGKELER